MATRRAVAAAALISIALAAPTAIADCIYCNCNKKLYRSDDLQTCQNECQPTLGCFTGICNPVGLPGREPTFLESFRQDRAFPNMACYSVTGDADERYNCVGSALGFTDRFIDNEVDGYGDRNGRVSTADFDAFLGYAGYSVSATCSVVAGREKIALFGEEGGNPPVFLGGRFHLARQASGVDQSTGPWFESKEGAAKKVMHRLQDFSGGEYGNLIKCYERPSP